MSGLGLGLGMLCTVWPAAEVDWTQAWLAPYLPVARQLQMQGLGDASRTVSVADRLNAAGPCPVRFVPQSDLPAGQAYEQFIFDTGQVPTRDNLHDFFNGVVWLSFPQTKRRLNQLQAAEIAARGAQGLRGPVRDGLTVFDENAAFLIASEPLWDALLARDWQRLFVALRPCWQDAQLLLFGHALLEKLVLPRKSVVTHVWCVRPPVALAGGSLAQLDAWIAQDLHADQFAAKRFAPLPVLGVPGWWPGNQCLSFYDDPSVFRPRAQR